MAGLKFTRKMNETERICAERIFGDTLPWDRIIISNTIGLGKRPYTTPELKHKGGWVLHLGSKIFADTRGDGWLTFIHELTHVWQSYNSSIKWAYAANSVCQQIVLLKFGRAYNYTVGKDWNEYHAEQQAQIVEDWCGVGMYMESDSRFRYIRDHIRRGIH